MPKSTKKEKQEHIVDQESTASRGRGSLLSSLPSSSSSSSSPPSEPVDMKSVFPSSKIKSMLRQEEQIGRVYSSAVDLLGASSALFIQSFKDYVIATAKDKYPDTNGAHDATTEKTTTIAVSQSSKIAKTISQPILITAEHILKCLLSNDCGNGNEYDFMRDTITSIVTTKADSTEKNKSSYRKKQKTTKNQTTVQMAVQVPNYSQMQNKKENENDILTTSRKQKRKTNAAKDLQKKKSKVSQDIGLDQYLNSNEFSKQQMHHINDASPKFYDDDEIIEDEEEYD